MAARKKGAPAPAEVHIQSLEEIDAALPPGDPVSRGVLRRLVLGASSPEDLIKLGASYRTEDILDSTASALSHIALILKERRAKKAPMPHGYSDNLVRLTLEEALALRTLNVTYEQQARRTTGHALNRRAALKTANSRALKRRRTVARKLSRLVLSADASVRAELDRAVGTSSTPAETIASLRTVASILAETRAALSREERAVITELGLGDDDVAALRKEADEIQALSDAGGGALPPQPVDQRALDRQDGIVLTLLRAIFGIFRDAAEQGMDVPLPRLGPKLERLVARTSAPGSEDEEDVVGGGGTKEPQPEGA